MELTIVRVIHLSLAFSAICTRSPAVANFFIGRFTCRECPHCREQQESEEGRVVVPADNMKSTGDGSKYSLLSGDEQADSTPRSSEDTL